MSDRINFNQLFYFWVIAKEGSIKKASQKLFITPSGLSGQLRYLEEFFGKKLFERKVRRLVLNDVGRVVFEYATNIFKQGEEMVQAVKQAKPKKQVLIRVGVLSSLSKTHIHEFVMPLWKDRSVSVVVQENSLDELFYQLDQERLDLILSDRSGQVRKKKYRSYRLKPRKIVAVGNSRFADIKKNFPKSLTGFPMICLTQHSNLRTEIDDYFDEYGVTPQIIGEADDVILLRLAAVKGVCVAVLPLNTVHESIARGELLKLGELKGVNSDMWAILKPKTRHEKILEQTIKRFCAND